MTHEELSSARKSNVNMFRTTLTISRQRKPLHPSKAMPRWLRPLWHRLIEGEPSPRLKLRRFMSKLSSNSTAAGGKGICCFQWLAETSSDDVRQATTRDQTNRTATKDGDNGLVLRHGNPPRDVCPNVEASARVSKHRDQALWGKDLPHTPSARRPSRRRPGTSGKW